MAPICLGLNVLIIRLQNSSALLKFLLYNFNYELQPDHYK